MSKDADVQRMRVDGGNARQPSPPRTAAGRKLRDLINASGWVSTGDGFDNAIAAIEAEAAAPAGLDVAVQELTDLALPTGGTVGPLAWTPERIRERERFAREAFRILRARLHGVKS